MRAASPLLPFAACALLAACGGGGGTGGSDAGVTQTKGNVVAIDGQSSVVSGVQVRALSTGAADVSRADGTFDLGALPARRERLAVRVDDHGPELEVEVDLSEGGSVELHLSVSRDHVDRVGEEHCHGGGSRSDTRTRLTPLEAGLEGHVGVRRRDDGRQGFDVEAEHLAPGRALDVAVIDPVTAAEDLLGRATANALGEAEWERRTQDGQALPFGVADVRDLEDFRVEVRDAGTGQAVLRGTVPAASGMPACGAGGGSHDDDGVGEARLANLGVVTGTAEVELRSRPDRGEEKIEVHVEGSNAVGTLRVWLEDPAQPGTLVEVGTLQANGTGLEFERDTHDGETLPFGVSQAADLSGLAIEVRRASDGAVLFGGTTPPVRLD